MVLRIYLLLQNALKPFVLKFEIRKFTSLDSAAYKKVGIMNKKSIYNTFAIPHLVFTFIVMNRFFFIFFSW